MSMQRLASLDDRQRKLAAFAVISLVIAALSVYVVLPQAKTYRSKSASRLTLLGIANSGADLPREIQTRTQTIADLSQRLHGDSANLPLRQMESFVIGQLQKISWDHDMELISVRPGAGTPVAEFQETLFRVELEGEYARLHQWLWAVRRELGFVVIKEFSLNRVGQTPSNPPLRATLTIASYRMTTG